MSDNELAIADRIEGLKQPYEHGLLKGQEVAEATFLETVNSGRLHHAWLLSGPRGTGKATFAFRIARYFSEASGNMTPLTRNDLDKAAMPDTPAFRKIAGGSHPNVLHLRIPYDDKTKKFKTQLTVDEIRRTVGFFGTTAGDTGWRVAIVDSANDMNANAANALLKILEEPPQKTLFFLLSDQPDRLLPTIRSRCQHLPMARLKTEDIVSALNNAAETLSIGEEMIHRHESLIGGSVRRAYHFIAYETEALLNDFNKLIAQQPSYDIPLLHRFADNVSARGADERFSFFIEFLENYLSSKLRQKEAERPLVRWAEVWDKVHARLNEEERLNLDRKQTVLALFHDLRIHSGL